MKLTVDIVEEFINSLDLSGRILSFSDDGTNTTLTVEKTFHARKGMTATIDGDQYEITAVSFNQSITIAGVLPVITVSIFTLDNPFYFHGTPIMTNNHISQASENEKTPMIYLYEILREKDNTPNQRVKRESEVRFFFLDSANFQEWDTEEHYSNRLKGLNALIDVFIKFLKRNNKFYTFETDFNRTNHVNWGIFINDKGHTKRLFADNLTGVELSFTLKLYDCGGSDIEKVCRPATAVVKDQDGNILATENIPSGVTEDININVGTGLLYTYNYPALNTGQDVSYATGDDKWVRDNIFNPEVATWDPSLKWVFPVLDPNDPTKLQFGSNPDGSGNNIFGNKERFTDTLGNVKITVGINEYVLDHFLGEYIFNRADTSTRLTWSESINFSNIFNVDGLSVWHLGNANELRNINIYNGFSIIFTSDRASWSSTTDATDEEIALFSRHTPLGYMDIIDKTIITGQLIFRKAFTYNPTTKQMELS